MEKTSESYFVQKGSWLSATTTAPAGVVRPRVHVLVRRMSDFTWEWLAGYFSFYHIHRSLILVFTGCFFTVSPTFFVPKRKSLFKQQVTILYAKFRGTPSLVGCKQGCATRCIFASGMQGNGERMRKWRGVHSLHLLIFSLFPPSLCISYIYQNLSHFVANTFVANVTKNLLYALWENMGRIRCEEAP